MDWTDRNKPKPLSKEEVARAKAWTEKRMNQELLENIREDMAEAVALMKRGVELMEGLQGTEHKDALQTLTTTFSTAAVNLRLCTSAMDRLSDGVERVEHHLRTQQGEG